MNQNNVINIKHASVFLGGNKILKDFSWQVKAGDHHFILGANGAGKTTLVKMLMGYAWPVYGATLEVLGHTYGQVDLNELRKKIAWVSPLSQQFTNERTGLDIVVSGPDGTWGMTRQALPHENERALAIMAKLDCTHLADQKLYTMSSGEQVKIQIARALMSNPKLFILDEASVYLDITSREYLLETVETMVQKIPDVTIIFITQRIEDITPIFQKGLILRKGIITAIGSRDEVLTEENLEDAFKLKIKLIKNAKGRFWPVIE